jgi:tRNA (cytidine32/uridine32-2'-O)-methyltransferase
MADGERAARRLRDQVRFVLVQPQHPGNVGAVARAMRNFGLRQLTVVDPPPSFDLERARWMAPGAHDVLDAMHIAPTLEDALTGCALVVGTTARHRSDDQPVWEPPEAAARAFDVPDDADVAVLFGREDTGLAREHTLRCGALLRIPTDHHASLNLGQAALLIAQSLFHAACQRGFLADGRMLGGRKGERPTRAMQRRSDALATADATVMEPAVLELLALLDRVGYTRGTSPEKVAATLREVLQRAAPTRKQVFALRGMVSRTQWTLDQRPGARDEAPEGTPDDG